MLLAANVPKYIKVITRMSMDLPRGIQFLGLRYWQHRPSTVSHHALFIGYFSRVLLVPFSQPLFLDRFQTCIKSGTSQIAHDGMKGKDITISCPFLLTCDGESAAPLPSKLSSTLICLLAKNMVLACEI